MKISLGSRTSGRKLLKRAIWELIYEPQRHWPDDSYFHRRNREKLSRAWRSLEELHDRRPQDVVQLYVDLLNQRASASTTTIYLMSNGGSGSHFMGALLDGLPEFKDDEYLARQVSGTYSFLSFAATQRWDRIVRYEDLRSNPTAVIGDIVRELGIDFDANLFEKVRAQHDARRKAANDDRDTPGNLNLDPPPALTDTQRAILNDGLQALALQYGYQAEAAYYW